MRLIHFAWLICVSMAWSSTALAQWEAGILVLWEHTDPSVNDVVVIPTDPAVWQTTAPYIHCRRLDGICAETWDPASEVLVIDAPILDDTRTELDAYQATLQHVLDLVDDPQAFSEAPGIMVTDLVGAPEILTARDLDAIDTYQRITDEEVQWSGSAVTAETRIP